MSCSSCEYLKGSNKKRGALCGCIYYCVKTGKYVNGSDSSCSNYMRTYSRNNFECDEIFKDGELFCNDSKSVSYYVIILIFLVIIAIFINR